MALAIISSLFLLYFLVYIFAVLQETTFLMVFSLILVFLIACFLVISLGFEFLGYLILIIYIGAIAVLFLFMVMLFDRAEYKIFNINKNSKKNTLLIFFVSFLVASVVVLFIIVCVDDWFIKIHLLFNDLTLIKNEAFKRSPIFVDNYYKQLFFNVADQNKDLIPIDDLELIGLTLYSDFFLVLILAGLGLLVAMIGCIILTQNSFLSRKLHKIQNITEQLNRYKL